MTRKTTQTHTLQCWPGGQSFEYRGDPDSPPNQRSLRTKARRDCPHCHGEGKRTALPPMAGKETCPCTYWRKGTAAEWRQIRIELRAELYQRNFINGCDSSLVDDLIKLAGSGGYNTDNDEAQRDLVSGFGIDEIRNIYADPSEWDGDQCLRYLWENTGETNYRDRADRGWDNEIAAFATAEGYEKDSAEWDQYVESELETLREACREHAQENPAEVYEWWRVDSWLCEKLDEIGEVTIDNSYGSWWGRCATGQQLIIDGVLQRVAALYEPAEQETVRHATTTL